MPSPMQVTTVYMATRPPYGMDPSRKGVGAASGESRDVVGPRNGTEHSRRLVVVVHQVLGSGRDRHVEEVVDGAQQQQRKEVAVVVGIHLFRRKQLLRVLSAASPANLLIVERCCGGPLVGAAGPAPQEITSIGVPEPTQPTWWRMTSR